MICPKCGAVNEETASVCLQCKSPLGATVPPEDGGAKPKRRIWPFVAAAALVVAAACLTAGILLSRSGGQAGNTPGNLSAFNGGLATQQGDWVYYLGTAKKDGPYAIHRARPDGTSNTVLPYDKFSYYYFLNAADGWVYYITRPGMLINSAKCTIEKMRTDGTGRKVLQESDNDYLLSLTLMDGKLYFAKGKGGKFNFYRMNTDGTGLKKLPVALPKSAEAASVLFVDDWMYYINHGKQDSWGIEKIRTDGTGKTVLLRPSKAVGAIGSFVLSDGTIYYIAEEKGTDTQSIGRVSIDGTGQKTLLRKKRNIFAFNAANGIVYYSSTPTTKSMTLSMVRSDGTGNKTLIQNFRGSCINIVGDWVYLDSGKVDYLPPLNYRMRLNGKNLTKLN